MQGHTSVITALGDRAEISSLKAAWAIQQDYVKDLPTAKPGERWDLPSMPKTLGSDLWR